MGSGLIIDRLVNLLGSDLQPDGYAQLPQLRRSPPLSIGDLPALAPDKAQMEAERFARARFWLLALRVLTRDNAGWGQGGLVDIEQNSRLGRLLDGLRGRE
jgi:hypothetical protein